MNAKRKGALAVNKSTSGSTNHLLLMGPFFQGFFEGSILRGGGNDGVS